MFIILRFIREKQEKRENCSSARSGSDVGGNYTITKYIHNKYQIVTTTTTSFE